jgi:hypothetical protein
MWPKMFYIVNHFHAVVGKATEKKCRRKSKQLVQLLIRRENSLLSKRMLTFEPVSKKENRHIKARTQTFSRNIGDLKCSDSSK